MFYYINGTVEELLPNLAVLDCGGVGFQLNTSANTLSRLKKGERARLYTYVHIREDVFEIYGFSGLNEKRLFEQLLGVSGVGPRAALSILSTGSPEALVLAIVSGDEKALTAAAGVGKKIAQRVILELKDKMARETERISFSGAPVPVPASGGGKRRDAAAALAVLGYSSAEIAGALKDIDLEAMSLEDAIKAALKQMMK
ncbi:MAG: Holliday junction branch migration protein RuvA [Oscillospiraceae bacterium]|nr:Holliday junction branch migration protein RuvA [Oscillospiraceae bacterium]MBR3861233.1 Holliday junction branch migration protein RuvA [Oscillospiraceae bacterium]